MFAKRFSTSFGLFPDTEKLAFRSQPSGLQKLYTVRVCRIPALQHIADVLHSTFQKLIITGIKCASIAVCYNLLIVPVVCHPV